MWVCGVRFSPLRPRPRRAFNQRLQGASFSFEKINHTLSGRPQPARNPPVTQLGREGGRCPQLNPTAGERVCSSRSPRTSRNDTARRRAERALPNVPSPTSQSRSGEGRGLKLQGSPRSAPETGRVLGCRNLGEELGKQEEAWMESTSASVNDSLTRGMKDTAGWGNSRAQGGFSRSPADRNRDVSTLRPLPTAELADPGAARADSPSLPEGRNEEKPPEGFTCESLNLKQALPGWLGPKSGLAPSFSARKSRGRWRSDAGPRFASCLN